MSISRLFRHLERVHMLSQRNAIEYTIIHWWMFKVGLRNRDGHEIIGNIAGSAGIKP